PLAMDVQPRASEYGARRHHACHEVGDGRLAPLLATAKSGGITERPKKAIGGMTPSAYAQQLANTDIINPGL
ncbi:hypothetical protein WH212_17330, partial [Xanthomonas perforans]|uniref:hypothetical protein n=1 Tax=Xanthomonas perforans TaxID=442694 RepID=UPI00321A19DA